MSSSTHRDEMVGQQSIPPTASHSPSRLRPIDPRARRTGPIIPDSRRNGQQYNRDSARYPGRQRRRMGLASLPHGPLPRVEHGPSAAGSRAMPPSADPLAGWAHLPALRASGPIGPDPIGYRVPVQHVLLLGHWIASPRCGSSRRPSAERALKGYSQAGVGSDPGAARAWPVRPKSVRRFARSEPHLGRIVEPLALSG